MAEFGSRPGKVNVFSDLGVFVLASELTQVLILTKRYFNFFYCFWNFDLVVIVRSLYRKFLIKKYDLKKNYYFTSRAQTFIKNMRLSQSRKSYFSCNIQLFLANKKPSITFFPVGVGSDHKIPHATILAHHFWWSSKWTWWSSFHFSSRHDNFTFFSLVYNSSLYLRGFIYIQAWIIQ